MLCFNALMPKRESARFDAFLLAFCEELDLCRNLR